MSLVLWDLNNKEFYLIFFPKISLCRTCGLLSLTMHIYYLKKGFQSLMFCLLFSLGSGRTSTRPTSSLETKTPGMLSMCSLWDFKVPCIYRASSLSNDHIPISIFVKFQACLAMSKLQFCLRMSVFLCSLLWSKYESQSPHVWRTSLLPIESKTSSILKTTTRHSDVCCPKKHQ